QAIAVDCARLVFCSGQIPLDPASGQMVGDGDVRAQTKQVMENLKAVLEAAGSGLDRVVRTTIFLADLGDFATVNEVYGGYFTADPPARATVQVAALPRGARVEIDAIATAS
ncbi:MAG TPA: Rid family detoxifying hydrolase, partial [Polyangia bacterium]